MKKGNQGILLVTFMMIMAMVVAARCKRATHTRHIMYINSYHRGYPSSDEVMNGIFETLSGKNIQVETFFLDTKRHPDPGQVKEQVEEVLQKIEHQPPDLIIASDDHAVADLVVPHLQQTGIPIVFCGVNWSAEDYDLGDNVTGMLEVLPLRQCIAAMKKRNPGMSTITVLSENTRSEIRNTLLLDTLYRNQGLIPEYRLVDHFDQWQDAFLEASESSDLIYLPTNGGIRNWDRERAVAFVREHTTIPAITCDDFMMEYCAFGLTKIAGEQGVWAANAALRILSGTSPSDIPFARNARFNAYLNLDLAKKAGLNPGDFSELGPVILE